MINNTNIVPSRWVPVELRAYGNRIYKCTSCGIKTSVLKDGKELSEYTCQGHFCFRKR